MAEIRLARRRRRWILLSAALLAGGAIWLGAEACHPQEGLPQPLPEEVWRESLIGATPPARSL